MRNETVDIGECEYIITSDDDYLEQIKNGFEPEMVKLFKTLATKSNGILDIGANIGCTALLFGELAKRVYAFEPSRTTYEFLRMNTERQGRNNISLYNFGLGEKQEETTLTFSPSNRSGGFVSDKTKASAGHVVESIVIKQVDEVVKSSEIKDIDFIKIDVEGFEEKVLRGAKQVLAENKPVVVLELNHWCLNAFQRTSVPDFLDYLRGEFPILLAVDGESYLDLHDESESYIVMYHHILNFKFSNIIAAYCEDRLEEFRSKYNHGY